MKLRLKIFSLKRMVLSFLFLSGILLGLNSCKVSYSFTGTTIDPQIQTFSIQYFQNRAPVVQAQLSQVFTDELRDRVQGQTRLELVSGFGDVDFSGEITNYETRPTSITGDEVAALNRLTITIRVEYTNSVNPDESFDTNFSRYEDYPSTQSLADAEEELIESIVDQIVEDIFNRAFVNW
ncbi:MAG: LptE family protein [Bacteroidales bacterium]